ncbi:hypothetical protein P9112_005104 [Eukaryota sp. TZLM1-RC]
MPEDFHCEVCDCYVQQHDKPNHLSGQRHRSNVAKQQQPHPPTSPDWTLVRSSNPPVQGSCKVCGSHSPDPACSKDFPLCQNCVQKCPSCTPLRIFKGSHHNAILHYKSLVHKNRGNKPLDVKGGSTLDNLHWCPVCKISMSLNDRIAHEKGKKHQSMVNASLEQVWDSQTKSDTSSAPNDTSSLVPNYAALVQNAFASVNRLSTSSVGQNDDVITQNDDVNSFSDQQSQIKSDDNFSEITDTKSDASENIKAVHQEDSTQQDSVTEMLGSLKLDSMEYPPGILPAQKQEKQNPVKRPKKASNSKIPYIHQVYEYLVSSTRTVSERELLRGLLSETLGLVSENMKLRKQIVDLIGDSSDGFGYALDRGFIFGLGSDLE